MAGKVVKVLFVLFLIVGLILMVLDEIYRRMNKEELVYMDIALTFEGKEIRETVREERQVERFRDLFRSLAKAGSVVWFGVPDVTECPLRVWDNWEKDFYKLCEGRDGKWYVELPGSSGGRSTDNYYEVGEEEVKSTMEKVKTLLAGEGSL